MRGSGFAAGLVFAVGCGSSSSSTAGGSGGSSGVTGSGSGAESAGQAESESESGTTGSIGNEAPDCSTVVALGDPADVAATPRADRDAELLALALVPDAVAAPQVLYDVIADDLAQIRAVAPELDALHVQCQIPAGYTFWFDDAATVELVWWGDFHGWDCLNATYGVQYEAFGDGGDVWRIDGLGFAVGFSGVFGEAVVEQYRALPGLADASVGPLWEVGDWFQDECEALPDLLTLDATTEAVAEHGLRRYDWQHPKLGTVTYTMEGDGPPVLVR